MAIRRAKQEQGSRPATFGALCIVVLVRSASAWETDFYAPPVLGGAALLPFSAPAVYKNPVP